MRLRYRVRSAREREREISNHGLAMLSVCLSFQVASQILKQADRTQHFLAEEGAQELFSRRPVQRKRLIVFWICVQHVCVLLVSVQGRVFNFARY